MHQKINKYLKKYFGFKVVASGEGKLFRLKGQPSFPLVIEFVGIAAVGKSTIYRQLMQQNKALLSQKRHVLKYEDSITSTSLDKEVFYQKLAENKVTSVASGDIHSIDKMRIIKYFHSVLQNDYLCKQYNTQHTIVGEEGILHNFGTDIENVCDADQAKSNTFFNNRAIIYCFSTPEQVAVQIRKRFEETGRLVPQHKVDDFDELVVRQKVALENKRKNISFFEKVGIPVLHINTSDPINNNINKINQFIKNLQE